MAGLQGLIGTPTVGLHGDGEKQDSRNPGFEKTDTPADTTAADGDVGPWPATLSDHFGFS